MDSNSIHCISESIYYPSSGFKNISSVKKLKMHIFLIWLAQTCSIVSWHPRRAGRSNVVAQGSADFFSGKGQSKYYKLYGPYGLCCNCSTLPLCMRLATDNT